MINFGANNLLGGMNPLGMLGGGGLGSMGQMAMVTQMMQMMMQLLSMFMGMGGSMGLPMGANFGGGGGSPGYDNFLGGGSPGGGGYGSPGSGGGYASPGGGGSSAAPSGSYGDSASAPTGVVQGAPPSSIKGITPYQFGLNDPDQGTMCGLVAAQGMARSMGKDIPMAEIKNIAMRDGLWGKGAGMYGPDAEVKLLERMGIPVHRENKLDWNKVIEQVNSGKPVILDTEQHYWVIEGYDPATGKFDFGNSARAMKASNGNTWYTPQELAQVFGRRSTPRSLIYRDA